MKALLLHLEAIPAMTEGKKRKKKKTRQLQIGVEKPPVLSELCSLFICHGGPDSHECTAQQQAAKKKSWELRKTKTWGKVLHQSTPDWTVNIFRCAETWGSWELLRWQENTELTLSLKLIHEITADHGSAASALPPTPPALESELSTDHKKNRKKEKNELKKSQNELFLRLPAAEGFIITKAGRMTPCQARNARKQTL